MARPIRKAPKRRQPARRVQALTSRVPVALRVGAQLITDWTSLPLNLSMDDIIGIQRQSWYTIHRRIKAGTFPEPDTKYPHLWKRDRFRTWFEDEKKQQATPSGTPSGGRPGRRRPRQVNRPLALR